MQWIDSIYQYSLSSAIDRIGSDWIGLKWNGMDWIELHLSIITWVSRKIGVWSTFQWILEIVWLELAIKIRCLLNQRELNMKVKPNLQNYNYSAIETVRTATAIRTLNILVEKKVFQLTTESYCEIAQHWRNETASWKSAHCAASWCLRQ